MAELADRDRWAQASYWVSFLSEGRLLNLEGETETSSIICQLFRDCHEGPVVVSI